MSDKSRNTLRLRDLLDRFDFRPLSTRSLLLSFLLGTHPPELSVERLVHVGERFGVRPGTVRTTLSRMVASGDLTSREARYRLSPRLLERQRQQDEGQHLPEHAWDGTWWSVVVAGTQRSMAERRRFRSEMTAARMGEVRPDIWMRPTNSPRPTSTSDVIVVRGTLTDTDGVGLMRRLWPIDGIETRAAELRNALEMLDELLDDSVDHLPLAFDVSAVCVRLLRDEPRLPHDLVDMVEVHRLRRDYITFNARFRLELGAWLRASSPTVTSVPGTDVTISGG